ncbi:MAG TPA: DUF3846 domain-containing protein, partial [Clostridia bacterium]|nr:DUF3846 domain-containing protein [Clostridia bacterium]
EGLFECVYLDDNCIAVVNEEGKINGMVLNRRIGNDIIAGPFFICGATSDHLANPLFQQVPTFL